MLFEKADEFASTTSFEKLDLGDGEREMQRYTIAAICVVK